jgi:hypothetical protein
MASRFAPMSGSLMNFLKSNPFWAVIIIIFMILPIIGAIVHILLKAFGRRGIDNSPTLPEKPEEYEPDDGAPAEKNEKKPPETNRKI